MDDQYSSWTALLYVFNVIVGTGALTLPKAFSMAGWLLSSVLMVVLAIVSYITVTFVIEAMATCNGISQWTSAAQMRRVSRYLREAIQASEVEYMSDPEHESEDALLLPVEYIDGFPSQPNRLFSLDKRIELSEMVGLLFNKYGKSAFYLCLFLYLYGDLSIYSASVSKSLLDATCVNYTNSTDDALCSSSLPVSLRNLYWIYLGIFLVTIGPFVLFNVQKTKALQFFTSVTRWTALTVMIGLAIVRLLDPKEEHGSPSLAVPSALPALIGSSVYAFMCHHSLPAMIAPISDKSALFPQLALDYAIILAFYLGLSIIGVFAFPHPQDLYTLDFTPEPGSGPFLIVVDYFLTLFPVFTLTATFPVMAVTIRNNYQAIFKRYDNWFLHKVIFPLIAVVPPILVALFTENIETLVKITGSYAGVAIEYLIPAVLVLLSRNALPEGMLALHNPYTSPFKSPFWAYFVIAWAAFCWVLVTFNLATHGL